MRVVFARYAPHAYSDCGRSFPKLHPTVDCPFPGWCVEILMHMIQFLNVEVVPIIMNNPSDNTRIDTGEYVGSNEGLY